MKTDLLNHLIAYYEEDPNDAFNIYALATEYKKTNSDKALELYLVLISNHPQYIATYYHLGKLYEDLNDNVNAIKTYENGITIGQQLSEIHAVRELQNALNELLYE